MNHKSIPTFVLLVAFAVLAAIPSLSFAQMGYEQQMNQMVNQQRQMMLQRQRQVQQAIQNQYRQNQIKQAQQRAKQANGRATQNQSSTNRGNSSSRSQQLENMQTLFSALEIARFGAGSSGPAFDPDRAYNQRMQEREYWQDRARQAESMGNHREAESYRNY